MSKRGLDSEIIKKYTEIYKCLSDQELAEEFNALSDQMLACLIASDSSCIQIVYSGTHELRCEYRESEFAKTLNNHRQRMN